MKAALYQLAAHADRSELVLAFASQVHLTSRRHSANAGPLSSMEQCHLQALLMVAGEALSHPEAELATESHTSTLTTPHIPSSIANSQVTQPYPTYNRRNPGLRSRVLGRGGVEEGAVYRSP